MPSYNDHQVMRTSCTKLYRTQCAGFGLIEIMIASVILVVSLLGIAALQSKAANSAINASRKEIAIRAINNLSNLAIYAVDGTAVDALTNIDGPLQPACNQPSTGCSSEHLYRNLAFYWKKTTTDMLPSSKVCVCKPQTNIMRVGVNWKNLAGTNEKIVWETVVLPGTVIECRADSACSE